MITVVGTSRFNQNFVFMLCARDEGAAHIAIGHETIAVTVHFIE